MRIVLTFTGRDQKGVVHRLSSIVKSHGGNWDQSRMAHLSGRFAGVIEAHVPDNAVAALTTALEDLASIGIRVLVDTGSDDVVVTPDRDRVRVVCTGTDRLGIVEELTALLKTHDVNILEMETDATEAPMAGGWLFEADLTIDLPPGFSRGDLMTALNALGDSQLIEILDAE